MPKTKTLTDILKEKEEGYQNSAEIVSSGNPLKLPKNVEFSDKQKKRIKKLLGKTKTKETLNIVDITGWTFEGLMLLKTYFEHWVTNEEIVNNPKIFIELYKSYMDFLEKMTNNPFFLASFIKTLTKQEKQIVMNQLRYNGYIEDEEDIAAKIEKVYPKK